MGWRKKGSKVPKTATLARLGFATVGNEKFTITQVDLDEHTAVATIKMRGVGPMVIRPAEHVTIFDAAMQPHYVLPSHPMTPVTAHAGDEVILTMAMNMYTANAYTMNASTWHSGKGTITFPQGNTGPHSPVITGATGPYSSHQHSTTVNYSPPPPKRTVPKDADRSFSNALIGHKVYTYELASGEPIYGEFGWVTDLEYFDDRDGEIVLKRKRWLLLSEDEYILPDPLAADDDERGKK